MTKQYFGWVYRALLSFVLACPASACLWDYDTLKQEAARFPGTIELLAGKFNRHSSVFYEWRIEDRTAKLAELSGGEALPLMDDLAVAYDKVGRTDEGIALMREALAIDADRYETHANLGTLLVHAKRYEEGLEHLRRAVEINPDAHFGREKWQIYLIEYILERMRPGGELSLPLRVAGEDHPHLEHQLTLSFQKFLGTKNLPEGWREDAIRGIEGMMRFGNHDSPVLNEALGDLLGGRSYEGEQRLAARAYLKAAAQMDDPEDADLYRLAADQALSGQRYSKLRREDVELSSVEAEFLRETQEGDAWFAQIIADETEWIASHPDPESAYDAKYQSPASIRIPKLEVAGYWWEQPRSLALMIGVVIIGLFAFAFSINQYRRHKSASPV
ncbi:MAG: tetratricopeptide repeat protein [Planctomycetota bacterium]